MPHRAPSNPLTPPVVFDPEEEGIEPVRPIQPDFPSVQPIEPEDRLDVATRQIRALPQLAQLQFDEGDLEGVRTFAQTAQEEFITAIREFGRTPRTVTLLKEVFPTITNVDIDFILPPAGVTPSIGVAPIIRSRQVEREVLETVFPERFEDVTGAEELEVSETLFETLGARIEEDPSSLVQELFDRGWDENTETLLQILGVPVANIAGVFEQLQEIEERRRPLQESIEAVFPGQTIEGLITMIETDPALFNATFISLAQSLGPSQDMLRIMTFLGISRDDFNRLFPAEQAPDTVFQRALDAALRQGASVEDARRMAREEEIKDIRSQIGRGGEPEEEPRGFERRSPAIEAGSIDMGPPIRELQSLAGKDEIAPVIEWFKENISEPFAAVILEPFYNPDYDFVVSPLGFEGIAKSIANLDELLPAYKEWDSPWGVKGATEAIPELIVWSLIPVPGAGVIAGAVKTGLKYVIKWPVDKAFQLALNKGLDKWLLRQGLRGDQANVLVKRFLEVHGRTFFIRARDNYLRRLRDIKDRRAGTTPKHQAVADDLIQEMEPLLLQSGRQTRAVSRAPNLVVKPVVTTEEVTALKTLSKDLTADTAKRATAIELQGQAVVDATIANIDKKIVAIEPGVTPEVERIAEISPVAEIPVEVAPLPENPEAAGKAIAKEIDAEFRGVFGDKFLMFQLKIPGAETSITANTLEIARAKVLKVREDFKVNIAEAEALAKVIPRAEVGAPEVARPTVERIEKPLVTQVETIKTGTPATITGLFQGRGATPAQIFGQEAVEEGRAVPLFGKADYFALTEEVATQFGTVSRVADIQLNNPFVLDSDTKYFQLLKDADVPVLDSRSRLFVEQPETIPAATEKLQEYLKSLGHDGIVVRLSEVDDSTRRLTTMAGVDQVVQFRDVIPTVSVEPPIPTVPLAEPIIKVEPPPPPQIVPQVAKQEAFLKDVPEENIVKAGEDAFEAEAGASGLPPPNIPPGSTGHIGKGGNNPENSAYDMANNVIPDEDAGRAALRLWTGKRNRLATETIAWWKKGNKSLKKQGIGKSVGDKQRLGKDDSFNLFKALHGEGRVPPKLKDTFDELKLFLDQEAADMLAFDPSFSRVLMAHPDYFPRGWKPPKELGRQRLGAKPGFLKPRVDATFNQMVEAGWEPISWNPYDMAALRRMAGTEYREGMVLVDRLKTFSKAIAERDAPREGWRVPKVGPAFEGKPYVGADGQAYITSKVAVPNNVADVLESTYGIKVEFRVAGVDIFRALTAFGAATKRAKLFGSLFQHVDFLTRDFITAFTPEGIRHGLPLKFPSLAARVTASAVSPTVRGNLERRILSGNPLYSDSAISLRMVADSGWQLGQDELLIKRDVRQQLDDIIKQAVDDGQEIKSFKKVVRVTAELADPITRRLDAMARWFETGLFDGVYRESQAYALEHVIIPRLRRLHPTWTDEQIAGSAAEEVNKQFSTLAVWQSVLKQPAVREVARALFFSWNETESWVRQASSAVKGKNAIYWREYAIATFISLALAGNVINLISEGKPLPPDRYVPVTFGSPYSSMPGGIAYNSKFLSPRLPWNGRNGQPIYLDIVGQADTYLRWMLDPVGALGARYNVLPRAVMNQIEGKDFWGRELTDLKDRSRQAMTDLFMPIGAGNLVEIARSQWPAVGEVIPEAEGRVGDVGSLIQATGLNVRAIQTNDMLDRFAKESGLKKANGDPVETWGDLEPNQRRELEKDKKLQAELGLRGDAAVQRNYPGAAGFAELDKIDQERLVRGEALVGEFTVDLIGKERNEKFELAQKVRDEVSRLKKEIRDRKSQVDRDFKLFQDTGELPTDPNKRAMVEYYNIFDKARRPSGTIDWEKVNELEADLRENWTAEQTAFVDRNIGLTEWGPLMQEFIDSQRILSESGYYDVDEGRQRKIFRFKEPSVDEVVTGKFYNFEPIKEEAERLGLKWNDVYKQMDDMKARFKKMSNLAVNNLTRLDGFSTEEWADFTIQHKKELYVEFEQERIYRENPGFWEDDKRRDAWTRGFREIESYVELQTIIRDSSASSKLAKWYKITHPNLFKEGLRVVDEQAEWADNLDEYVDIKTEELTQKGKGLQLWVENAEKFIAYDNFSDETSDSFLLSIPNPEDENYEEGREFARARMLEDEDFRKTKRTYEALDQYEWPDDLAAKHVEYHETELQSAFNYTDFSQRFYLQDNDDYYEARREISNLQSVDDFSDLPDPKYQKILLKEPVQAVLKQYEEWSEKGLLTDDRKRGILSVNEGVEEDIQRLNAYKLQFPNDMIETFVKARIPKPLTTIDESAYWAKNRTYIDNPDFFLEVVDRQGLTRDAASLKIEQPGLEAIIGEAEAKRRFTGPEILLLLEYFGRKGTTFADSKWRREFRTKHKLNDAIIKAWKFDKIPTPKVERLYAEYLSIDDLLGTRDPKGFLWTPIFVGERKWSFRNEHDDLQDWGVAVGKWKKIKTGVRVSAPLPKGVRVR